MRIHQFPLVSLEAGRHTSREGAVGHASLVLELADMRMWSYHCSRDPLLRVTVASLAFSRVCKVL